MFVLVHWPRHVNRKHHKALQFAFGKSRGVLNDQTAGAQGDHHLIYFDQTARPLAQGGPSNIFVNQKASSAQGDHLFSRRTAAPCGVNRFRTLSLLFKFSKFVLLVFICNSGELDLPWPFPIAVLPAYNGNARFVGPKTWVALRADPRRLEDCIEYENEMRSALFNRASTSDRKIGSSHKPPVGHLYAFWSTKILLGPPWASGFAVWSKEIKWWSPWAPGFG
jgi:hypothetical protein